MKHPICKLWLVMLLGILPLFVEAQQQLLQWGELPSLQEAPTQSIGLGGALIGVHNDALLIAGGSNFPEAPPWEGGGKAWYNEVVVLQKVGDDYSYHEQTFALPHPIAYATAISLKEGVLCIGGRNADSVMTGVFLMQWEPEQQAVTFQPYPSLPTPLAFMAGAKVGETIYIAGGQQLVAGGNTTHHFFALNLNHLDQGWVPLPPWPGPSRLVATAVGQNDGATNCFYLMAGRNVAEGQMTSLADVYKYNPATKAWSQQAAIPLPQGHGVIGATGIASGVHHILVFGGADGVMTDRIVAVGKRIKALQDELNAEQDTSMHQQIAVALMGEKAKEAILYNEHPGFSRKVWAYHTITNTWAVVDTLPFTSQITTNAVKWGKQVVIPSGEVSPGVRTSKVKLATLKAPQQFGTINYVVLGIYLLLLVGMGIYFSRREKTTDEFFKAGGRIPWWAAGLSIFGTSLSAISYMAIPAKTFATDWTYFIFSFSQVLVAPVVIWLFLPVYRRLNLTTAYEYLEERFHAVIRLIGSTAFLLFQFGRVGIVLFLPAIALSVVTGFDIYFCIVLTAVLSTAYTAMGGIEAVIWTDVIQVVLLMGGAILCLFLMAGGVDDGWSGMMNTAAEHQKFKVFDFMFDIKSPTFWVLIGGGFAANLITNGSDQTIVQRYMTTRNEKSAAKSIWTNALMVIPAIILFFGLGTALYTYYEAHPAQLSPAMANADAIFPWYIITQLPDGVSGLLIAGIFAAAMSSLDSSMNSTATVITNDFYRRYRPEKTDRQYLRFAKRTTVVVGGLGMLFALLMAGWEIKSLWDEFSKILGLFTGGLGGLFILGMVSKRANTTGALVGFLCSGAVQFWVSNTGNVHFMLYTFTGLVSCLLIGYLASLLLPGKGNAAFTIVQLRKKEKG